MVAIVLGPYLYGGVLWLSLPQVLEVSTDLIDPPATRQEAIQFEQSPTIIVARLVDAYPEITGRRYDATPEFVFDRISKLADERGWTLVSRRGSVGISDDLFGEFMKTSMLLAIPRTIVIRVRDENDKTLVDMRAKLEFVNHDLGTNAKLISSFLSELDFALIGKAE
ncbi:MAG: DUF1499 domain-containing protein [Ahrensia sp.]|nr:DUF1499 domain-containing protein [Ahrensia sp.]